MKQVQVIDAFRGDRTGIMIPAHPEALSSAGGAFLTEALRAFGAITAEQSVAELIEVRPCPGGSTGAKVFADVRLAGDPPGTRRQLFVKFSRDFTDERRDSRGKWEMQSEARFEWIARNPRFPIKVARPWFADYEAASGSGLVITDCVAFGTGGIEPHRRKCIDHRTLPDPLAHYRAVVKALARLAAAHKAGELASDIEAQFPFDPAGGSADPIRYDRAGLRAELDRCFAFARDYPQLLPERVRTPGFLATMERDVWRVFDNEARLQRYLTGNPDLIALDHWNAHIDNCWFERTAEGELACGLIDWGRVGQITFGSALWGGLSAAHHAIWDNHLDELLGLFVTEYAQHGGPIVSADELLLHLTVHMATMGVARVLAFPEVITFRLPECRNATGPLDPMFDAVDPARNSLHIYTVFLKFWQSRDFGRALDRVLGD